MFVTKVMTYNLPNVSIVNLPKYNFIKHVKYCILHDGARYSTLYRMSANAQSVIDSITMMQTCSDITCSYSLYAA